MVDGPIVRRQRGFLAGLGPQGMAVLGVLLAVAAVGAYVLVLRAQVEAADARAVVAEQSMRTAMEGAAAERRAREALQAERERLSAAIGTRDRLVRAARRELEAAQRAQLEGRTDDACLPLDAPLCPAAARVVRGDADGGGAGAGGGASDAAAGAAAPLP